MINRLALAWSRCGITVKLWLVFGVLFAIFGLAGMLVFVGLSVVRGAQSDILANMEIRTKIVEMEGQLEKSRRLYRDFILQLPEMHFDVALERYCQPSLAVAARVIAISEDLKRLIASSRPDGAIARRNVDITLFTTTAKRYSETLVNETELLTSLAGPEHGFQVRLVEITGRIEAGLSAVPQAALPLRELDVLEKEYEITRRRPVMQAALNKVAGLKDLVRDAPELSSQERARIFSLLDAYGGIAADILRTVRSIRANVNDFALQAKAIDPIFGELKALSESEVAQAKRRSEWASRMASVIIGAAALLELCCIWVAGQVLHASITGKIETMTRHAAAVREGHLDVVLVNGSSDELGVLAGAFNAMTARVRELVDTLEEKVRLRTQELAATNLMLDARNQELAMLSMTDRLTGLCNRRKLDLALAAEWRRAKRYGTLFSVIMVDLDHFKNINDTYGHAMGDRVLVHAADILLSRSRETDTVGRWGGEEFLIVCPQTDGVEGVRLAEELRCEFEQTEMAGIGRMTASFGLAEYVGDNEPGHLVSRADVAMYRAKKLGRNRVEVAGGI